MVDLFSGVLNLFEIIQRSSPSPPLQALREGHLRVMWEEKVVPLLIFQIISSEPLLHQF